MIPVHCGECPTCGKLRYPTRKVAKAVARRLSHRGTNEYRCGDYWHIGHLPTAVRRGTISRDALVRANGRKNRNA